ncbi:hypothetical protein GGX14DRAFT_701469 [Mycena pura]|uniref:F-box domain-containing protein n=1 Tax=Mycena pura TaxID=153505 RepID=A0AAD6URE8_9AGAR|nr:hypothetical protein GGX14DRAFT_701469 [Mycena pura]
MAIPCEKCGYQNGERAGTGSAITSTAGQRAALAQIDAEILEFKEYANARIAALEEKRQSVAASLALVVYPVLTLPAEITSCFFIECLPPHGRVRPSPSRAPLLLAQVCRHWREVALFTGALWSSFDYVLHEDELYDDMGIPPWKKSLVECWLSRSRGHALSWTIRRSWDESPPIPPLSPNILSRLWRLEVDLPEPCFNELVPLHTPLPQLQCLAAHLAPKDLQNILRCAPQLRELNITSMDDTRYNLVSQTIVKVEILGYIPVETFLGILNNCPLLSHFSCQVHPTTVHNPTPTTFRSLQSLNIVDADVLKFLTLPNLTCLEFISVKKHVFHAFVSRSSCNIRELHIIEERDDSWEALKIPSVQTLEVNTENKEKTLANLLRCLDPNLSSLLPQLRHLRISTLPEIDINLGRIIDMVGHRRNAANMVELQSVSIIVELGDPEDPDAWWHFGDTIASQIRRLNSFGLKFTIQINTDDDSEVMIFPDKTVDPCKNFYLT